MLSNSSISRCNPQTTFVQTSFPPSSFWGRRQHVVRTTTLLAQLDMLKKTGRFDAFKLNWHPIYDDPPAIWPVPKHLFWDSDVAKWIEGACYFLSKEQEQQETTKNEVKNAVHELVEMIRGAQQKDGYLNIHFTVVEPRKRFTNLRDLHELYNAGHLIEAALAHHYCFKNNRLLDPILKYVSLLCHTFGPGEHQIHGYPGHPEIELALLRLYRLTENPEHLQLARYFLDERGNPDSGGTGMHFYELEKAARGEHDHEWPEYMPVHLPYRYQQAHLPITKQPSIEGHAVRAMYLLTAVADLSVLESHSRFKYAEALRRLWDNMVSRKMYLTGGIGAVAAWEGFGSNYFLPQGSDEEPDEGFGGCYAETCAAIGVVMLAERMLRLERRAEYADVLELCLYNAMLTGMSHGGNAFTYVNQLASSEKNLSKRNEWFEVSCCPPNLSRLMGSIGGYVWTMTEKDKGNIEVDVHMYTTANAKWKIGENEVELKQKTDLPIGCGSVNISICGSENVEITMRLRIPGWAASWKVFPDPGLTAEHGYIHLSPSYLKAHPDFRLDLQLTPRLLSPHPLTNQHIAAVARGPIVYCVEDVDNPWVPDDHFRTVLFDTSVPLVEENLDKIFPDESIVSIKAENSACFLASPGKYNPVADGSQNWKLLDRRETLRFIPYYARANREGKGMMRVGLRIK